jgi:hypothetical protein
MMFARFKFVVKRYCVHAFYKSRALTGHSVFRLLCVVTLFKLMANLKGGMTKLQLITQLIATKRQRTAMYLKIENPLDNRI